MWGLASLSGAFQPFPAFRGLFPELTYLGFQGGQVAFGRSVGGED